MKKLLTLLKTKGKTKEEIKAEVERALRSKNLLDKDGKIKFNVGEKNAE